MQGIFSGRRWGVAWMLFIAGVINYMDRSALSIAAPLIRNELKLDDAQMGIVFSSFFFGYAIFNFIGGYCSDRFGAKNIFLVAMIAWSLFCGLTAVAMGMVSLVVIRILFGIGEGPFSATANKAVSNWFPLKEAAGAVGLLSSGTPLGGAIAGPVVGFLAVAFGWRVAFVIIAALGLVWALGWYVSMTDKPRQHPRIKPEELKYIEEGQVSQAVADQGEKKPLGYYLRQPLVLATALAFFSYNYILFFFLTWFPTYLTDVHHLSIKEMSITTVIPWVVGFLGLFLGGFISDAIFRATGRPALSRKIVLVGGLGLAAVSIIVAGNVTSVFSAVTLMSVTVFCLYLTGAIYWAIIQDNVPPASVGSVGGFVHFLANVSGILGPTITGLIIQKTGAYTSAFFLAGAIAIVGAAGILIFLKDRKIEAAHAAA